MTAPVVELGSAFKKIGDFEERFRSSFTSHLEKQIAALREVGAV